MAESGHAINLAHFSNLITAVESFGGRYNPSGDTLKVAGLKTLHDQADADIKSLTAAKAAQSNASNTRDALFAGLDTLSRRIQSSAKSAGATPAQQSDIEETARKIKGDRAGTRNAAPVNPGDPKSISVSQQSYVNLASHLEGLITALQAITSYKPNEADLKIAALQALWQDMDTANKAVSSADIALNTARSSRNSSMYGDGAGLVDIAALVKDYVFSSSKDGAKSPDYKAVKGISFTRLKK